MKRIFALLIAAVFVFAATIPAYATDYGCNVNTDSRAVYLESLNTGAVIFEKNADEKMYPASTTKVMTFIVVIENVPDPENTVVQIKEDVLADLDPESSVMGLTAHISETVTVMDLLYGLMLPSGNDAALVLADYVGHGVSNFVDLMNQKAAQLGCENTHFVTPHGFHDERQYSTARDMATLTKYAMQKMYFNEICATTRYSVASYSKTAEPEIIETTNYMIDQSQKDGYYYYPYAKGIKTGYTDEAGRCLISRAEDGEYHYLCVTLGAPYSFEEDINYAMLDSAALYDWAFENLSFKTLYQPTDVIRTVSVGYVWGEKMTNLVPKAAVKALLPNDYDESLVSTKVECETALMAPVTAGEKVGAITVFYDDREIGSTDIVTFEDIKRDESNYIAHKIVDFITEHLFIVIVVILVVILLIVLISISGRNRRRERQRRRYR